MTLFLKIDFQDFLKTQNCTSKPNKAILLRVTSMFFREATWMFQFKCFKNYIQKEVVDLLTRSKVFFGIKSENEVNFFATLFNVALIAR